MMSNCAGMGAKTPDFRGRHRRGGSTGPRARWPQRQDVRSSQLDLAAGQAFSIFSECDAGDAVMSGGFDVGANFTLEEFRPATTDPEQWIYGGANLATSPLQAYWWIVCLDMTP